MLCQRILISAGHDAGKRNGYNLGRVGFHGRKTRVIRPHDKVVGAVAAERVRRNVTFQCIGVVTAGIYTAAGTAAACVILITVVGVYVAGNTRDRTETTLPNGEILIEVGAIDAVVRDPAIVFVESRTGQAAVIESGGAVQRCIIASGFNGAAESLDNGGHRSGVHGAVRSRFNIIENRIVELAALENIEAEFRFFFCHLRRGGVAEMVYADRDVVCHAAGIILFKAGVFLSAPVFSAVAGANDRKVYQSAVGDGRPIDISLIIGNVNSHQRYMDLTGGVTAIREIGGYRRDSVADTLHTPAADRCNARVAGTPGLHSGGTAA